MIDMYAANKGDQIKKNQKHLLMSKNWQLKPNHK